MHVETEMAASGKGAPQKEKRGRGKATIASDRSSWHYTTCLTHQEAGHSLWMAATAMAASAGNECGNPCIMAEDDNAEPSASIAPRHLAPLDGTQGSCQRVCGFMDGSSARMLAHSEQLEPVS